MDSEPGRERFTLSRAVWSYCTQKGGRQDGNRTCTLHQDVERMKAKNKYLTEFHLNELGIEVEGRGARGS